MKTKLMALDALKKTLQAGHGLSTDFAKQGIGYDAAIEAIAALEADIAKGVEPVAWMRDGATSVLRNFVLSKPDSGPWIPLYTTPQEPAAAGWMSIETAPKDGTYLVHMPSERVKVQVANKSVNGILVIGGCFGFDLSKPTHWMPLPAAPGGAA